MRRSLAVVALVCTTSLTPAPVAAAPVVGFVQGVAAGLFGSAVLGGTYLAQGFISGIIASTYVTGSFLGRAVLAIGLNAIMKKKQRGPGAAPEIRPAQRMVNLAQSVTYAEWVLGRTRKGGTIGFTGFKSSADVETGRKGKKRHYSVILAAHSCRGVVEHWLDERRVDVDGDGTVITDPIDDHGRIRFFTGGVDQVADSELVSAFPEITLAHDFAGLAGAHLWAARPKSEDFPEVYPTGRQWVYAPVMDGADMVYDPRDGERKFSRNAALLIAFWITKIRGRTVDWDEVAIEADKCDELVLNADGSMQPKWRIDGVLGDDESFEDQRAALMAACDCWYYERADGGVGFKVGGWEIPTIELSDDDFLSVNVSEGDLNLTSPSEIVVQYTEPANNYREATCAPYVIDANAPLRTLSPEVYFSTSHNQSARVAKRIGRLQVPDYTLSGTVGAIGYAVRGKRFFRYVDQELGIDAFFEVQRLERREGGMLFDIEAVSVTEEDFAFDANLEEGTRPEFASVENDDGIPVPGGLMGEVQDGGGILWAWTQQDETLSQRLRIRTQGETDWMIQDVPNGQGNVLSVGLVDLGAYEAQLQNQTASTRRSDWAPDSPVPILVDQNSVAPGALTSFSATVNGAIADVTFTAPNDANYSAVRIYRSDDSADIGDAVLVRTEFGSPGVADGWTDSSPPSGTIRYWAYPINSSGKPGPVSGPATVEII